LTCSGVETNGTGMSYFHLQARWACIVFRLELMFACVVNTPITFPLLYIYNTNRDKMPNILGDFNPVFKLNWYGIT